jgi:hypothetical protein
MHFRTRVTTLATLLALALVSGSASADPTPLADSLTGDAKASYESARLLYEVKDYAGAATKYRSAYGESHDPRLLWNIATCERALRHYARTATLIEQFIASAAPLMSADFVAQARSTLAALREFYSPLQLDVRPAGTHVFVDGEEVGTAPLTAPVRVDLGKHTLRGTHDGFTPFESVLDVAGQNEMRVPITLLELSTTAHLAIAASDPADMVTVDDNVAGSGQWEGDVGSGPHRVKVTAPGKKPYLAEIEVAAGEHRSIDVTLEAEHGRTIWPWIAGGAAVVAGGIVGSYFLFKPGSSLTTPPAGSGASTIQLSSLSHLGLR